MIPAAATRILKVHSPDFDLHRLPVEGTRVSVSGPGVGAERGTPAGPAAEGTKVEWRSVQQLRNGEFEKSESS